MKIDVINTAREVQADRVYNKTVVVIDILRATSVMTTAIHNGADKIIPVLSPDEAFEVRGRLGNKVVLGGERDAELIPGFDFGNSPLSYSREVIDGKALVITTTNGTLAIHNSLGAKNLYIASFLNAAAIVNAVKNEKELVLVCSGNNGLYTLEDNLCAGYLIDQLLKVKGSVQLSDSAIAAQRLYNAGRNNIVNLASEGHHYKVLQQKNFTDDLKFCFTISCYDVLLKWNGSAIVKAVQSSTA